jgi:hypothetical protein
MAASKFPEFESIIIYADIILPPTGSAVSVCKAESRMGKQALQKLRIMPALDASSAASYQQAVRWDEPAMPRSHYLIE